MVLDTQTTDELPTPQEGGIYLIAKVEVFSSAVQGFKGVRVDLKDNKGKNFVESLWIRPIVGKTSKLGSFIAAMGKEESKWVGKKIRLIKWAARNREIEVVK